MKTAIKRIGSFVLALAMILSLSLTTVIPQAATTSQVTFTNVAYDSSSSSGDTVTAYKIFWYDGSASGYAVDSNFSAYVRAEYSLADDDAVIAYIQKLSSDDVKALMTGYAEAVKEVNSSYSLPSSSKSGTASSSSEVTLTLDTDAYYLVLGETTTANSVIYSPAVIFVDSSTTSATVALKSEDSPDVEKTVYDGSQYTGGTINTDDYVLEFRIAVTIPDYTDQATVELKVTDTLTNLQYIPYSLALYSSDNLAAANLLASSSSSGTGTEADQLISSGYITT